MLLELSPEEAAERLQGLIKKGNKIHKTWMGDPSWEEIDFDEWVKASVSTLNELFPTNDQAEEFRLEVDNELFNTKHDPNTKHLGKVSSIG